MYALPELVADAGHFGGADLVQQRGTIAELAQICQAWGAALAALHTTATDGFPTPFAARPWAANPEHCTTSMRTGLPSLGYAAVLNAYQSSSDLRAASREVDERWTELHWIHGNLNPTNVVVDHQPALRVSFIDRDGVGLGDPAWDLASAVDTIVWLSPRWRAMSQPLVDYFLLGYRRAGGLGGSIRQSRPYGHSPRPGGSWMERLNRQTPTTSRRSRPSGWIGLVRTPPGSDA